MYPEAYLILTKMNAATSCYQGCALRTIVVKHEAHFMGLVCDSKHIYMFIMYSTMGFIVKLVLKG